MSAASSRRGLTKSLARPGFCETYESLVTRARLSSSERTKWVSRTNAFASSSSGSLIGSWPTASASIANDGESPESWFERRERLKKTANNGNGAGVPLAIAATSWATPNARDHFPAHSSAYIDAKKKAGHGMAILNDQAALWSTPSVADVAGGRKARSGSRSGELLNNSLAPYITNNVWPTATAINRPRNDETLAKCSAYRKAKAGQTTVPLYLEEVALSSAPQALATSTPGDTSPSSLLACYRRYRATTDFALRWERRALLLLAIRRRGRGWTRKPAGMFTRPSFRRQLNARFVEWLMSWPPGLTSFECSETALLTHKALWRSELASMTSLPAAPPAQLSLFG